MNTITIDGNTYLKAQMYAKEHNISVEDVFEKGLAMLLEKLHSSKENIQDKELEDAMALMETMMVKGGKTVPADEEGNGALMRIKYGV